MSRRRRLNLVLSDAWTAEVHTILFNTIFVQWEAGSSAGRWDYPVARRQPRGISIEPSISLTIDTWILRTQWF